MGLCMVETATMQVGSLLDQGVAGCRAGWSRCSRRCPCEHLPHRHPVGCDRLTWVRWGAQGCPALISRQPFCAISLHFAGNEVR